MQIHAGAGWEAAGLAARKPLWEGRGKAQGFVRRAGFGPGAKKDISSALTLKLKLPRRATEANKPRLVKLEPIKTLLSSGFAGHLGKEEEKNSLSLG